MVPNNIITPLIENRLKQTDCRVNGWILDGYPQTIEQVNHFKELKIKPSLVCVFEQSEEACIERLSKRRVDFENGQVTDIDKVQTDNLD